MPFLSDLSVAQLQGLTECAFALIRKVNLEMGMLEAYCGLCNALLMFVGSFADISLSIGLVCSFACVGERARQLERSREREL